ncbi:MAG: polysaccharide biosynthesis tyrosine autokinase [Planctomycetota bacterium]
MRTKYPKQPQMPQLPRANTPRRREPATLGVSPEMALEMGIDFLRRRGLPAFLLGTLLAGAVVFAGYSLLPKEYQAIAVVQISTPKDSYPDQFLQTQRMLITSPAVLNAALDRPEAKALPFVQGSLDPVNMLRTRLKVESQANSEIVEITMTGMDPQEIQTLVNSVVDAYVENAKDRKTVALEGEERIFRQEVDRYQQEIERLRRSQRSLADEVGQADPDSLRNDLEDLNKELAEKKKQRDDVRLKKIAVRSELDLLEKNPPQLTIEEERELRSDRDKPVEDALAKLELRADSIRQSSVLGDRDPEYLRVIAYVAKQRGKLSEIENVRRGDMLQRAKQRRDQAIDAARGNEKVLEETEQTLDAQRLALEGRIARLQKIATEIDDFKTKIADAQNSLAEVNKKLQDIGRNTLANSITIVSKAELPRIATTSKKRMAAIFGGGVGSFSLVVLLFWFFDFRMKLVSRPEHLQQTLSIPVLGILPTIPKDVALPSEQDLQESNRNHRQWQAMQEGINSLRITLTFSPHRMSNASGSGVGGLKSLMITSPRDGEGKSTLSAHLALSMARAGSRVVLVEADMHRPAQYKRFEVDRTPGLSDALQGTLDVSEAIHPTRYPGLYLLCAGSPVDDLTGILVPERLAAVFGYLAKQYDTIVVDAPPVLPVYDALLLGRQVEQTLLCVMCNYSQSYAIQQAIHRLESVGIEAAGLVVNGSVPTAKYKYYYGARNESGGSSRTKSLMNTLAVTGIDEPR